jgi:adenosylcobinamide-phosphate synthase
VLAAALAAGVLLGLFTRHYPFAWALELLLLVASIRLRRSHRLGRAVLSALERGDGQAARDALARLGARDLAPEAIQALPRQGLAVTARTLLERRLADGAVAPALWFGLLGLPGLVVWAASQRAALVLNGPPAAASPGLSTRAFGRPAALVAAVLRWPGARLATLLLALAGRLRSGRPPATPLDALAAALDRHALAGLLLAAAVVLPIVARLLLRAHMT